MGQTSQLCLGDGFLLESEQCSPELPVLNGMKLPRRWSRLAWKQTARMMLVVFAPWLVGFRNWKVALTPILSRCFSYILGQIRAILGLSFSVSWSIPWRSKKELEVPRHFAWFCLMYPLQQVTKKPYSPGLLLKGGGTGPASLTQTSSQSILSLIYYC